MDICKTGRGWLWPIVVSCMFCGLRYSLVQPGTVLCVHLIFHLDEITQKTRNSHYAQIVPLLSVVLEQIHGFKTVKAIYTMRINIGFMINNLRD